MVISGLLILTIWAGGRVAVDLIRDLCYTYVWTRRALAGHEPPPPPRTRLDAVIRAFIKAAAAGMGGE